MASKIHTDNPKHHKYVTTNKYERKKNVFKKHNIVNIIFNNNRDRNINIFLRNFIKHIKFLFVKNHYHKISNIFIGEPGCKIIYTDCNHTKYQVIKNGKYIKDKQGNIKTFKKY